MAHEMITFSFKRVMGASPFKTKGKFKNGVYPKSYEGKMANCVINTHKKTMFWSLLIALYHVFVISSTWDLETCNVSMDFSKISAPKH